MRKAQTWSTDALIAVVIFLFMSISIMYIVGNLSESKKFEQLADEGELIAEGITSSKVAAVPGFVEGTKLNSEKLKQFANRSYTELKSLLGLSADFCIHIEDAEGYLINATGNLTGVGSSKAKVSGIACTAFGEESICGDGKCTAREGCGDCPSDCGACAPLNCQLNNGACTSGSCVFTMFSSSNSHAAVCGTYAWNVCCSVPGCNTNCRTVSSSENCNPDETQVLTLFSTTNSHVAETAYSNKICCKLTSCSQNFNSCKFYNHQGLGGCEAGYACLASALSTTNSHVASCDAYPYNICCSAS